MTELLNSIFNYFNPCR